jgi:hypothetical protein
METRVDAGSRTDVRTAKDANTQSLMLTRFCTDRQEAPGPTSDGGSRKSVAVNDGKFGAGVAASVFSFRDRHEDHSLRVPPGPI